MSNNLVKTLKEYYAPEGAERVGFIVAGQVVECLNIAPNPDKNFLIPARALLEFLESAEASWHTHPNGSSAPTDSDLHAFRNYPKMTHYIVGKEGVTQYEVKNGHVIECERKRKPQKTNLPR